MLTLNVAVEEPAAVLAAYGAGALLRAESGTTETGSYAEVGTVVVVAGTRSYTVTDPAGSAGTWYRTRYSKATPAAPGDYSGYSAPWQAGASEGGGLICQLADVKQRLGLAETDTTEDEFLSELIRRVGDSIMSYTGRRFVRTPTVGVTTFLLEGRSGRSLSVPQGIAALTQLEVATSSQPQTGGVYSIVPDAAWFLPTDRSFGWPATRIQLSDYSGHVFVAGQHTIRLTGALGWAEPPSDIVLVAEDAVILRYAGRGQGYSAADTAGGSILLRGFSPEATAVMDRYRVPVLS